MKPARHIIMEELNVALIVNAKAQDICDRLFAKLEAEGYVVTTKEPTPPADEGEVRFGVTRALDGNVHVNFASPVMWMALPPASAKEFAAHLLRAADTH